jgi:hypothetical protein
MVINICSLLIDIKVINVNPHSKIVQQSHRPI